MVKSAFEAVDSAGAATKTVATGISSRRFSKRFLRGVALHQVQRIIRHFIDHLSFNIFGNPLGWGSLKLALALFIVNGQTAILKLPRAFEIVAQVLV